MSNNDKDELITHVINIVLGLLEHAGLNIIYCHHPGCNKWETDNSDCWSDYSMNWCNDCIDNFKCVNKYHISCTDGINSFCRKHRNLHLVNDNDNYLCHKCFAKKK